MTTKNLLIMTAMIVLVVILGWVFFFRTSSDIKPKPKKEPIAKTTKREVKQLSNDVSKESDSLAFYKRKSDSLAFYKNECASLIMALSKKTDSLRAVFALKTMPTPIAIKKPIHHPKLIRRRIYHGGPYGGTCGCNI